MNIKKYAKVLLVVCIFATCVVNTQTSALAGEDTLIRIFVTGDTHGSMLGGEGRIGFSALAERAREAKADLLLDAGDLYHGLSFATIFRGESVAEIIKAAGFDAMTVGNHEWNYGQDRLLRLEERSGVPILAANVLKDGQPFFKTPYLIKDVRGVKVGLFGVIDPAVYNSSTPYQMEGIAYADQLVYAKDTVKTLKEQGCTAVICLTHTNDAAYLAQRVDGIDLILAGHQAAGTMNEVVNGTRIVQAGKNMASFAMVSLVYDGARDDVIGSTVEMVTYQEMAGAPVDPQIEEIIANYQIGINDLLGQVIGTTPVKLEGDKKIIRHTETNLGRVVADAYLYETGAQVSFVNSGGIRASVEAGEITYGDAVNILPFGNYVVTKDISGQGIKDLLEYSVDIMLQCARSLVLNDESLWPENDGSSLQVGGLTYRFYPENELGSRVTDVLVEGEPLRLDGIYTAACDNYVSTTAAFMELYTNPLKVEYIGSEEALRGFVMNVGVEGSLHGARMRAGETRLLEVWIAVGIISLLVTGMAVWVARRFSRARAFGETVGEEQ